MGAVIDISIVILHKPYLSNGKNSSNDIDIKYSDRGSVSIHIFLIKIFISSRFHQNRHQNQHPQIEGVDFIKNINTMAILDQMDNKP